ncbi:hypothetical protein BCR36DRAFT_285363 [Piromyces finnis]|uniref:Uncharacterized protein n=1 Tax=Piromyces finnis TaxID=1754191 RepID=A0A1Y1VDW0_9FUNG|nr:hypothetical protein BCR36DRAFT_285363 [Piromyces finnis]|eukprot:ORX52933.1 hypothetical protein BCR36DRAFT_285363 [Piromyces finnis]
MTVETESSSQDEHKGDSSIKNRYWAKTNFGLSISYEFIKKYFLRDIVCKRSLKLYKNVEIYQNERNNCMFPILKEFLDREVYRPMNFIDNPQFAVTLSFNNNDSELVIIGPLCRSKAQAKIEASMALFKILYHFNCKLLPFVEGNNIILNKLMANNNTSAQDSNKKNESSIEFPYVFSRNGWEDIK